MGEENRPAHQSSERAEDERYHLCVRRIELRGSGQKQLALSNEPPVLGRRLVGPPAQLQQRSSEVDPCLHLPERKRGKNVRKRKREDIRTTYNGSTVYLRREIVINIPTYMIHMQSAGVVLWHSCAHA